MPPQTNDQDPLDAAYRQWREKPDRQTMAGVLSASSKIIDRASRAYGDSPAMRAQAKLVLAKSLPRYDPSRKVPLKNWMYGQLQSLQRMAASEQPLYVPERARQQLGRIQAVSQDLENRLGRIPSDSELADALRISTKMLNKIRGYQSGTVTEDAFIGEEGGINLPGVYQPNPRQIWLDAFYYDLGPQDRLVYENVMAGVPKREVAKKLGVSPAAVTQRAARIAARLSEELAKVEAIEAQR